MAAKAQQPINVVCATVNETFYAADNDLYITMNGTDYAFGFDIICATGATDIVDGQTYTWNDMFQDYSYGVENINQAYIDYTAVSFVRNSDGSYVADVTATDGTQYHITYAPAPVVADPTDTVTVMMTNATLSNQVYDLTASNGWIQLIGYSDDDNYAINVAFVTNTFAGSYTMADAYPDSRYFMLYSFVGGNQTQIPCNNLLAATVTGTQANCNAHFEWVANDGTMYDIYYSNALPEPADTIDITMNNAAVNEVTDYTAAMGMFQLKGADQNQEYTMYLVVNSDQIAGSYTQNDVNDQYSGMIHNGSNIDFITVSDFTVTGNAQNCSTYVEILGSDNIFYRINYTYAYVVPDATDTVDITMDNAEYNQIIDYTSIIGMYQLQGADQAQEYTMLLAVNSDQIAGSYTMSDVDMYYSGLIHINGSDTTYIDVIGISDFTVTGNAKGCSTYVEITGSDNTLYRINYIYTYVAPEPTDTVEITMDNAEFNKVYDQTFAGMFQLLGADQNEEYVMQLVVYSDQIAGNYNQSDVDTYYSGLYYLTATDTTLINIVDIRDFTVTGDSTACSAYVEMVSADLVLYKISFTFGGTEPIDPEAVENATETEFMVCSEGDAIMVYSEGEQNIAVFDMAGRMITYRQNASDIERIEISVPGIYVVRVGNKAVKAVVK